MRLALLVLVVGLAVGVASGWRRAPRQPPLRLLWVPVAVLAGVVAVVGRSAPTTTTWIAAHVVVTAALVAVGIVNHAHPGARPLTAGVLANGMVVIANVGMPVTGRAVAALGGDPTSLPLTGRHHLLDESSRLPWLADSVGVPWLDAVVSPGDLLLVIGAVIVLATTVGDLVARQRTRRAALQDLATPAPATPTTRSLQSG